MIPYEKLAKIYDKDWGRFSTLYLGLIEHLSDKYDFRPSLVLDVACGTGNLASELYNLDYEVIGIDISEAMINIAKTNNPEIQFYIADITDFYIDRKFDLITCSFDSMNYLTKDEEILKALSNIHSHLSDTGYYIFDINTPTLYEEKHFGTIDKDLDGIKFKQVLKYDKEKKIGLTIFDFGNAEREVHIQKAYSANDMDNFLTESGFQIVERFKDFEFSPIDEKAYKIFYIVRKM